MAATVVAATMCVGCKPTPVDDQAASPNRTPVVFNGKVEARFVGRWKSADGRSTLNLTKGGAMSIESLIATPHGDRKSRVEGTWLVSKGDLLLKYPQKGQTDIVLEYNATFANGALTLVQPHGRLKVVYRRK